MTTARLESNTKTEHCAQQLGGAGDCKHATLSCAAQTRDEPQEPSLESSWLSLREWRRKLEL